MLSFQSLNPLDLVIFLSLSIIKASTPGSISESSMPFTGPRTKIVVESASAAVAFGAVTVTDMHSVADLPSLGFMM